MANVRWTHWLSYWHRCNNTSKRCLMHEIYALPLTFNHTAVYAHIVIACDGPKVCMCPTSDNTATATDLMVI